MLLKIHTVHGVIFNGQVEKVEIPSNLGHICVLPQHNPLVSMVSPGIVKFTPIEKKSSEFISDSEFLFEDEKIAIAVGEGTIYTDGENVIMFVASATVNLKSDMESLKEMKENLEKQIKEIKESKNYDEIEKANLHIQKLTADMKLIQIKEKRLSGITK